MAHFSKKLFATSQVTIYLKMTLSQSLFAYSFEHILQNHKLQTLSRFELGSSEQKASMLTALRPPDEITSCLLQMSDLRAYVKLVTYNTYQKQLNFLHKRYFSMLPISFFFNRKMFQDIAGSIPWWLRSVANLINILCS